MALVKQGAFTDDFTALADKPSKTAAEMKALFQSQPAELKVTLNNLIDALEAVTDSASGADQIGMTPITETGAANTVQEVVEALITRLKAVTDSASGADLIGMTAITETGVAATVQSIVEALITRLKAVTDSASGADLIGATAITSLGAPATVQAILEALAPMTTQGDILYQGASAPARLAKGTAGQILTMNTGATAPAWATATDAVSPLSEYLCWMDGRGARRLV